MRAYVAHTHAVNTDGQLGRADAGRFDTHLRRVALPPVDWVRAGGDTSLARATDGRVWVWGNTEYGQACLPGDQLRVPHAMPLDVGGSVADARLGGSFALLLTGTYALARMHAAGTNGRRGRGTEPTLLAARVHTHAARRLG